jgi:hypothetical protein
MGVGGSGRCCCKCGITYYSVLETHWLLAISFLKTETCNTHRAFTMLFCTFASA